MPKNLIYLCLLIGLNTNALPNEKQSVSLNLNNGGKFDVLYHRAESAATGIVLAGLIGYGIEEGIRGGKDGKKKDQLLSYISDPSCKNIFLSSLAEKLKKEGYDVSNSQSSENVKAGHDKLSLNIKINSCGFKLVNTDSKQVSAFIDFKTILYDGNKNPVKQKYIFFGKTKTPFEELLQSKLSIEKEFSSVLKKAGKRLANKIVYRKK